MFVYSEISCEEILSFPIFLAWVRTCRYRESRAATPTVRRSAKSTFSPLVTKRHDSASDCSAPEAEPSRRRREPSAKGLRLDEVRERALAVDLDDRDVLAVGRLELRVVVDVDDDELEAELRLRLADDLKRPLAEAAPGRAVENNGCYGYRPRVVVASATRCTASP
jgi:hypothetical protein